MLSKLNAVGINNFEYKNGHCRWKFGQALLNNMISMIILLHPNIFIFYREITFISWISFYSLIAF